VSASRLDDQIAYRRKKPGRPIDFGGQQQERYKGRNVVERRFNRLKQWRGIAMRLPLPACLVFSAHRLLPVDRLPQDVGVARVL
jgi:transposase